MRSFMERIKAAQKDLYAKGSEITIPAEGLLWHMQSLYFEHINEKAYTHFSAFTIEPPEHFTDLPDHIRIATTNNDHAFFPEKWRTSPVQELAILDHQKRAIIYYCLCYNVGGGINPVMSRTLSPGYDDILFHIATKALKYLLTINNVIINSNNNHEGRHFWYGKLQELLNQGYVIQKIDDKNKTTLSEIDYMDMDCLTPDKDTVYCVMMK